MSGAGCSSIHAGLRLPSKVINLIIKRPENFSFSPGDWVFVKVPTIAVAEWHPFTISSAPEQKVFVIMINKSPIRSSDLNPKLSVILNC